MEEQNFIAKMQSGYEMKGPYFQIGAAKLGDKVYAECPIKVPLKMMNRHGLIAGATGTGKSKTLQIIAEQLSENGVPTLLMDIKGDLSGLAASGEKLDFIAKRYEQLGLNYEPKSFPVELLTISNDVGAQMRATVSEFGPVLLSKVLDLSDAQYGILAILFKYCDDNAIPILDLKDLTKLLQYANEEGKETIQKDYGKLSASSLSTILRKVIALQQQGADEIFGERSFDVNDLMRFDEFGKGFINILRVTNIQDKPAIFTTFMLQLLAEIFQNLPEEGDLEQPKLVMFIDEAHLIFKEASKELLSQIETTIKLIRSKGVGIFFCTQNPQDVPEGVLGQLGMKVQHALRAFTANDREDIRKTAKNYPLSEFYNTEEMLTSLGIGEAAVTLLNEKGVPTPLAHCFMITPMSRMDILSENELEQLLQKSKLYEKYKEAIDSESAFELLTQRIEQKQQVTIEKPTSNTAANRKEKSAFEKILNSPAGRQAQRTLVREFFGILKRAF